MRAWAFARLEVKEEALSRPDDDFKCFGKCPSYIMSTPRMSGLKCSWPVRGVHTFLQRDTAIYNDEPGW